VTKKQRNAELINKLDGYLEAIDPQDLFEELEGRYADGPALESVFENERHFPSDHTSQTRKPLPVPDIR
jgi:hypothetical protein